jgi:CysZ protein
LQTSAASYRFTQGQFSILIKNTITLRLSMFSLRQLLVGSTAFIRATPFLFKNRLGIWYLVPAALYFALSILAFLSLSHWLAPQVESWLAQQLNVNMPDGDVKWWTTMLTFLVKSALFLSGWVIKILVFLLLSKVMKYVILILLSPVLAYLSEKTDSILTGKAYPWSTQQFIKDIGRGILFALRSLFAELVILLGVGVISFFAPAISPLAVAFLFVVNCFYMGVSLMDYVAERRKLNVSESMNFMRENKWTVIGIGFMFNVFYMLPLLGIVLAPLNGAVGCVLAQHQLED